MPRRFTNITKELSFAYWVKKIRSQILVWMWKVNVFVTNLILNLRSGVTIFNLSVSEKESHFKSKIHQTTIVRGTSQKLLISPESAEKIEP